MKDETHRLNSDSSKSATSAVSSDQLPNSKKIYVTGKIHPDIRVPFREINLAPTKTMSGEIEVNEPIRVYDTSGPWGDPSASVTLDPVQGLPALRRDWILNRGDVEEIEGRTVTPIDDGYLSDAHAAHASSKRPASNGSSELGARSWELGRKPLRAKSHAVTQLAYARQGVITPEMEFIALRENSGLSTINSQPSTERNAL